MGAVLPRIPPILFALTQRKVASLRMRWSRFLTRKWLEDLSFDEGLTLEQMRGMLRPRHAQISQQLVEMQSQLVEVESRLHQIEREGVITTYDVVSKRVESVLVASVRAILPSYSASGTLFDEVYDAIGPHADEALGPNPNKDGQTLVLWYDTEYKESDVDGATAW